MASSTGDYGIDAPPVVRNLLLFGGLCLGGSLVGFTLVPALRGFLYPGVSMLGAGLWMVFGSKVAKLRIRDRILDRLELGGGERVLDVGCGRGLMLIGAARRLPTGKAIGLDLWRTVDQSGNDPEVTRGNARIEGVLERVEIETGDMTQMPFPDASFQAVVSSWAIHNIPTAEGRARALAEVARVLAPGGRLAIVDIGPGRGYGIELAKLGLTEVSLALDDFAFVIPSWRVTAKKPLAS